jgi:hypothetical protein
VTRQLPGVRLHKLLSRCAPIMVFRDGGAAVRPAEFLLDATGIVRWRNLTNSVFVRAPPEQLLEAIARCTNSRHSSTGGVDLAQTVARIVARSAHERRATQRGGHMKTWIGARRIVFIPMIRPADENRDGSVWWRSESPAPAAVGTSSPRRTIDQFEASLGTGAGVIVYRVAIEDNDPSGLTQPFIFLDTPSGLQSGQQYQTDGLSVTVGEDFYAGVGIEVVSPPEPPWQCGDWGRQLVRLQNLLDQELEDENPDQDVVRSLQGRIADLEERMKAAGCR